MDETDRPADPVVTPFRKRPGRPKGRKGNGPPDSPGSGRPAKLTAADMAVIVQLSKQGKSEREIARAISTPSRPISDRTVGRWLNRAKTSNEDLQLALASMRTEAIDSWRKAMRSGANFGKHAPARDLLQATGVVAEREQPDRITIVVGDGTVAIGRLPAAVSAHPVLPALPASTEHQDR